MIEILALLPLYIISIWTYFHPNEGLLLGERWKYEEEPIFTEEVLWFTRFASVIVMFFTTIILVGALLKALYAIIVTIGLFLYIIYSILKFRRRVLDEE
ncbi:hypothetical protein [Sutcliffiella horikoshii]|uniref:hypothetical protein n=1 Tax=Sutcliffiella horikoshii TaxID=79883 RepID=UPI00384E9B5D